MLFLLGHILLELIAGLVVQTGCQCRILSTQGSLMMTTENVKWKRYSQAGMFNTDGGRCS